MLPFGSAGPRFYSSIWVHVGNAQRGTYELFVALALMAVGARGYARSIQLSLVAFWAGTAGYVFFGAFDAEYIRNAAFASLL